MCILYAESTCTCIYFKALEREPVLQLKRWPMYFLSSLEREAVLQLKRWPMYFLSSLEREPVLQLKRWPMYFLSSLEREPVLQLKRWSTYAPLFPFLLLLFVGAVYMLFVYLESIGCCTCTLVRQSVSSLVPRLHSRMRNSDVVTFDPANFSSFICFTLL